MPGDFFAESQPLKKFKWVRTNAEVYTETDAQREFLETATGQQYMDALLEAKDEKLYWACALLIETHLERLALSSGLSL